MQSKSIGNAHIIPLHETLIVIALFTLFIALVRTNSSAKNRATSNNEPKDRELGNTVGILGRSVEQAAIAKYGLEESAEDDRDKSEGDRVRRAATASAIATALLDSD